MNQIESQPVMEIEPEEKIRVDIGKEVGDDLGELFKVIQKKFKNPDDGWTPARLAANSTEKLAPIISRLRKKLVDGGSADPDTILQEIINEAISQDGTKEEFIGKLTNPSKFITVSKIGDFNRFIAKGLEK